MYRSSLERMVSSVIMYQSLNAEVEVLAHSQPLIDLGRPPVHFCLVCSHSFISSPSLLYFTVPQTRAVVLLSRSLAVLLILRNLVAFLRSQQVDLP